MECSGLVLSWRRGVRTGLSKLSRLGVGGSLLYYKVQCL